MNIVFFIYHPVEPHFYNHVAAKLLKDGHHVLFVLLGKEGIEENLIKNYGYVYIKINVFKSSFVSKLFKLIPNVIQIRGILLDNKTDLIISATSLYAGLSCLGTKIFRIGFTDTESAKLINRTAFPFFNTIITPDCFYEKVPFKRHIPVKSYKEISYLHPTRFISNDVVLKHLGISTSNKIILMRFSALKALHDIGLQSQADKNRSSILGYVKELGNYARVFISCTERDMGSEFENYKLNIHPSDYINLLSFCSLYIGEGTTTASEAGVLGVPWINIQRTERGYLIDQEKNYNLGFRTVSLEGAFKTALNWIQRDNMKEEWALKRMKLLNEKIDFTSFLVWFIENYPESHRIMKNNPHYQDRFK